VPLRFSLDLSNMAHVVNNCYVGTDVKYIFTSDIVLLEVGSNHLVYFLYFCICQMKKIATLILLIGI